MVENGKALSQLLSGILDLATFESGHLTLEESKF
jgi:hypothetical protein